MGGARVRVAGGVEGSIELARAALTLKQTRAEEQASVEVQGRQGCRCRPVR